MLHEESCTLRIKSPQTNQVVHFYPILLHEYDFFIIHDYLQLFQDSELGIIHTPQREHVLHQIVTEETHRLPVHVYGMDRAGRCYANRIP